MSGDAAHCLALVRQADRDRYLASLFAPDERRPALLALYAFSAEIVRIRSAVSEPQIGEIRLQWWRDTVRGLAAGAATDHPVGRELGLAMARHRLPRQPLLDLIDAHGADLYDSPLPDLVALETYFGRTSSAVIQLAAVVLAGEAAAASADAAGLAGVAHGLARILAGPPQRRNLLPAGLSPADAVAHARRRLAAARAQRGAIAAAAFPAFLPASLADLDLAAAEGRGGASSPLRRQWRLWRAARRETF